MILCLGTYIKLLMKYFIQGTTNQQKIFKTLIGTIDSENSYEEEKHKSLISNLVNCKINLPTQGKLTTIVNKAKDVTVSKLKLGFNDVVNNLHEDQKEDAVRAFQYLIGSNETLKYIKNGKSQLFSKCMGGSANEIVKAQKVDLKAFLAGLFLFIVLTNDNTQNQKNTGLDETFTMSFPKHKIYFVELDGDNTVEINKIGRDPINPEINPENESEEDTGHVIHLGNLHQRILLDNLNDEDYFEYYPSDLYIVSLYFITLKYDEKYYLLLNYGTYMRNGNRWIDGHIWSVPYTNAEVRLDGRKVSKVKEIRAAYDEALRQTREEAAAQGYVSLQETLKLLENDMFYRLGIVNRSLRRGNEYIEYKVSASEIDKNRCYYIREFFVENIDEAGVVNLADPRCLNGHCYLPLSLVDNLPRISHRVSETQWTQGVYHFMGKAIPENVSDILTDKRKQLRETAAMVNRSAMIHKETGVLFKIAVSNSNSIFNTSTNKSMIDQQISTALELGMMYANVKYYMLDIYQVTGVMPDSAPGEPTDFTDMLEDLYLRLKKIVVGLKTISAYGFYEQKLLLRCTILKCEYEYGKIIDITSQRPGFAGEGFGTLRRTVRETHRVQNSIVGGIDGILLGFDTKDEESIKFSSLNARDYQQYSTEWGAVMKFVLLGKGIEWNN